MEDGGKTVFTGMSGGGQGDINGKEDKEGGWSRAKCGLGALRMCSQYRERDGEMGLELDIVRKRSWTRKRLMQEMKEGRICPCST